MGLQIINTISDSDLNGFHIQLSGNYLYIAATNGIACVDISTPTSPTKVGVYSSSLRYSGRADLAVNGTDVYASSYTTNNVDKVSFANPSSPSLVTSTATANGPAGILYDDGKIYVTHLNSPKLVILNTSMSILGFTGDSYTYWASNSKHYKNGNYLYTGSKNAPGPGIGNWLSVTNVSNASSPSATAALDVGLVADNYICGSGNYIFHVGLSAAGNNKYTGIIDISNPSSPSLAYSWPQASSGFNSPAYPEVYGDEVVVCDRVNHKVTLVDWTNRTAPTVKASIQESTDLSQVKAAVKSGNYIFAIGGTGLVVIEITVPTRTHLVDGSLYIPVKGSWQLI